MLTLLITHIAVAILTFFATIALLSHLTNIDAGSHRHWIPLILLITKAVNDRLLECAIQTDSTRITYIKKALAHAEWLTTKIPEGSEHVLVIVQSPVENEWLGESTWPIDTGRN